MLELMHELRRKINTPRHDHPDLGIVAVLRQGGHHVRRQGAEYAPRRHCSHPGHPYTEGLFNSIPDLDSDEEELKVIQGLMPDPTNLPSGCTFHPRCPYAVEACSKDVPPMVEIEPGHFVACPVRGKPYLHLGK